MWAAVAPGWAKHADYVDGSVMPIAQRMLDVAAPQAHERVLDLACGPGGMGLATAELLAPGGEVVLSDATAEMTEIAAARAEQRGLRNVSTRVLDLEQIDEPDASYDVVLCREGLMLTPAPDRAAREIRRILRPGGRVALSVWGPRERNPWLGIVFDAVSAQLGAPVPPPGMPGPFSLVDSERVAGLLWDAGLSQVDVTEVPVSFREDSFDAWWERRVALAGPLGKMLASLSAEVVEAIRAGAREATGAYETASGLELPGVTLLATGRRA
jgi:SAM-dependent methyltransferase